MQITFFTRIGRYERTIHKTQFLKLEKGNKTGSYSSLSPVANDRDVWKINYRKLFENQLHEIIMRKKKGGNMEIMVLNWVVVEVN